MRFTKSHSYFSFFFHQQAFLHPLVSATYIPVLKRPVCGFGCKVSVPVFLKFPIFPLLPHKIYIPYSYPSFLFKTYHDILYTVKRIIAIDRM